MYGIYAISFLMMIFMLSFSLAEEEVKETHMDADIVARHMVIWHKAARFACANGGCTANGEVSQNSIRTYMPSIAQGAPIVNSNVYRSYTNGVDRIVTIHTPSYNNYSNLYGALAGALIYQSGDDKKAGAYDRVAQRISKASTSSVTVPRNIGGLNLPDGLPILGSKF